MNLKKKLAMGIATGALAVSMIGGGTYAYFNDVETSVNEFAAGTLNLSLSPKEIINVDNIKPRDKFTRTFNLKNDGSLNIAKVLLNTNYLVKDKNGNVVDISDANKDFGKHIKVKFMWNVNNFESPVMETTLAELKTLKPDLVADKDFWLLDRSGMKPNETNILVAQFEFVDNGEDQNEFQGKKLELTWKFDAQQGEGISK